MELIPEEFTMMALRGLPFKCSYFRWQEVQSHIDQEMQYVVIESLRTKYYSNGEKSASLDSILYMAFDKVGAVIAEREEVGIMKTDTYRYMNDLIVEVQRNGYSFKDKVFDETVSDLMPYMVLYWLNRAEEKQVWKNVGVI
jgi:hypothetical protein